MHDYHENNDLSKRNINGAKGMRLANIRPYLLLLDNKIVQLNGTGFHLKCKRKKLLMYDNDNDKKMKQRMTL